MRIHVRENWYRDVWLAAITILAVVILFIALHAIDQIQASRLAACQAENQHHDNTLAHLAAGLKQAEQGASPAKVSEVEASRAPSVDLINQLAPRLDCALVFHRTRRPPPRAR